MWKRSSSWKGLACSRLQGGLGLAEKPGRELLDGALEFWLLHALRRQALPGSVLAQRLAHFRRLERSAERRGTPGSASLPAALGRLEQAGWLAVMEQEAGSGFEAVYAVTPAGRAQLQRPATPWAAQLLRWLAEGRFDALFRPGGTRSGPASLPHRRSAALARRGR